MFEAGRFSREFIVGSLVCESNVFDDSLVIHSCAVPTWNKAIPIVVVLKTQTIARKVQ